MMLANITPVILTFNESPNIGRTLDAIRWAERIIVVDSHSTDSTIEILQSYPQVEIFTRTFDTFANQRNFGIEQVQTEWVLSLDADHVLTEELIAELKALSASSDINSYITKFKYCVFGKPLKGTLLPPRPVLFRREKAVYEDDGHSEKLDVAGKSRLLSAHICHDDRKSLGRWLWAQDRYMVIEAKKLLETNPNQLSFSDRIRRKKVLAPFAILIYCLFINKVILDGWNGWYYTFQRILAEVLLSIRLIEAEKANLQS
jgi:glycosyltransferase involved in cell wall biosynthesis